MIKKIFIGALFLCMAALTFWGFFLDKSLVAGSISSMETSATSGLILPVVILIIFGLLLYSYFRAPKKSKLVFLFIAILLWVLSGRMISLIVFPEGKLITGWYYIPIEKFNLCDENNDCETVIAYQTKTEDLPFWRVRIENKNINKTIFVGPFLWRNAKKLIQEKIGNGTYTK